MKVISKKPNNSFLILEGAKRSVLPELKEIREFSKILSKKVKEQFGMNFKFLITWGSSLGGILRPLEEFLKTGGFHLNETEITLILVGVGSIIFFENEEKIKKVIKLIEEKGLMNIFVTCLKKSERLKDVFISFIESLNVTTQTLTNILGYAFLIPILPMILNYANSGDEKQLTEIILRISYFTSVSFSGIALKEIVEKIIKRFKG